MAPTQVGCGVSMSFYLVYCKLMRAGYIAQRRAARRCTTAWVCPPQSWAVTSQRADPSSHAGPACPQVPVAVDAEAFGAGLGGVAKLVRLRRRAAAAGCCARGTPPGGGGGRAPKATAHGRCRGAEGGPSSRRPARRQARDWRAHGSPGAARPAGAGGGQLRGRHRHAGAPACARVRVCA
jgi:hypothetical protein